MNLRSISTAILCFAALVLSTPAQTVNTNQLNWGSQEESLIVDSNGNRLPVDNFTFDLGSFIEGFTPDETNVSQWASNWRSFNQAIYSFVGEERGVFASEYTMYDSGNFDNEGGSSYGDFETLGISRNAYIWVYNSQTPEPGTEWFLARSADWVFPMLADICCDNSNPIEWSMGDLWDTGVVPVWGGQNGEQGSGVVNNFQNGADLQTYTFIPEPSSVLLIAFGGLMAAMRRNRQPVQS